jgi:hypothetical protein
LQSAAEAHEVVPLPDVHRALNRTVNVEGAYKVNHCVVHYEFGTFGGTAYSFVRVTHEDRGYVCTYRTRVVGVRDGDELTNGPQSEFSCAARTPKPCISPGYYRWARSTVPNATIYSADVQVNAIRGWPPPQFWQKNYATISPA